MASAESWKVSLKLMSFALIIFSSSLQSKEFQNSSIWVNVSGQERSLIGALPKLYELAPAFIAKDLQSNSIDLTDFKGRTVLVNSVPSLNTGVCRLQGKQFNDEISHLSNDVTMLTISTETSFLQSRACYSDNADNIVILSDSVWHDFSKNYGLLIEGTDLLARAIMVINKKGQLEYRQVMDDVIKEPDYADALIALKRINREDF
ncbi:thiol peroxidase [Parashewanella spongiae]|uniref:Thiol peroxidase n=1 Tax=Parashewanella spongiae TaxID=342950 RepID=A0A3A6UCH5_9GAMM|nr:redoxin family protein [Parashewanella spongiae]MCL1078298.1 redoxin family protein [Parashewanella spongiae]RJY15022.1 thiol peroxidase [Parashewanella spongiae]